MILVVDDTPANIDILLELLSSLDDISVALDGEDALEIMEEEKPLLVLLDIVMPGMDGYEVCSRIKGNENLRDVPVIFLSGNDSPEEKARGLSLGAVDFLTKPVDPEVVMSVVRKQIGRAE